MEGSKLNREGILLFEQPFARVAYEGVRKAVRSQQRDIEREIAVISTAASDLSRSDYDPSTTVRVLEAMIARVEVLRAKLAAQESVSTAPALGVLRDRLDHLGALDGFAGRMDPAFDKWADTRLDRWLVDWALRTGRVQTARDLARERHIEHFVDIDLFHELARIEDALVSRSCTEALAWCSENKTALKKAKSPLEFELRLQEYIEHCRAGRHLDALAYSKRHLQSWADTYLPQIQRALGLLVFPADTACPPYKRLYDHARWNTLAQAFRSAAYALHALPTAPLLSAALYAGLAALKLPACIGPHDGKHPDCPVCDQRSLGALAKDVPSAHHVNSTIVCKISGKIMDADNAPLAFPSKLHVYSTEALQEMAAKDDGFVTCPRTGEVCRFTDLKKVYLA